MNKSYAINKIKEQEQLFTSVADSIWEYAELSLQEYQSADLLASTLENLGFEVEREVAGIKTAFLGKFGAGRPVIGILGEFDALTGLSQAADVAEHTPIAGKQNGHGCGHHLLGAGALAAAYGIKEYLRESGREGTVIFYGTPGEEGGAAKAFMAKEGIFYDLDCALTWHPADVSEVVTGTCNSCIQTLYKFHGVASHAAGSPELGRSALDAVELMNIGVQFLREHTGDDARIHYAIVNGGGLSPNVVQPEASVLYMTRATLMADTVALQARVDKIAEGAAMMTDTTLERIFVDGCSNTVPNHTIEKLLYENYLEHGVPTYTDEELAYAERLRATFPEGAVSECIASRFDPVARARFDELSEGGAKALNDFLSPLYTGECFMAGSTDVGDVSWQTPTVQLHALTYPAGAPGHSWQNVAYGKSSVAHKGMMCAGEVLCMCAIDLYEKPHILMAAREEFAIRAKSGYVCPIPDGEHAKIVEIN